MRKKGFNKSNASPIIVKKKISNRFRNINIFLLTIIIITILATMSIILQSIASTVSKDYAHLYADNAVGVLNTYLKSEIALITKAARSDAIISWFDDEENTDKKQNAYNEMMGIIDVSAGKNLYLGINKSMHEYAIEDNDTLEEINAHATLSIDFAHDNWYFTCVNDSKEYMLNVDIDKVYNKKLVWLNHKVIRDGEIYGVISTGLDFSQVLEKLFSEYGSNGARSILIDEEGIIHMDSDLHGDENLLYTLNTAKITDDISDTKLLRALQEYIKPMDNFYDSDSATTVLELTDKEYQYATIAPIESTTWSVITLYNSSALFGLSNLRPVFIIIPLMIVFFILILNATLSRMFLKPFHRLVKSIESVNRNHSEQVYGLSRNDEIGELANTVQNMKDSLIDALSKVHYDALTSVYNRRYFDENMRKVIDTLQLCSSELSILLLDIDYFKNYNDIYGHNAGDQCLKNVATILSSCIENGEDFVARYGGEEFVMVLQKADSKAACNMAQKVLNSFEKAKIPHMSSKVKSYVTVSIGIATVIVNDSDVPEDYIIRADKALYQSKENGRNQYTVN